MHHKLMRITREHKEHHLPAVHVLHGRQHVQQRLHQPTLAANLLHRERPASPCPSGVQIGEVGLKRMLERGQHHHLYIAL